MIRATIVPVMKVTLNILIGQPCLKSRSGYEPF